MAALLETKGFSKPIYQNYKNGENYNIWDSIIYNDLDSFKIFIKNSNINQRDRSGRSLAFIAAKNGSYQILKELINRKAIIDYQDLDIALENNFDSCVLILLKYIQETKSAEINNESIKNEFWKRKKRILEQEQLIKKQQVTIEQQQNLTDSLVSFQEKRKYQFTNQSSKIKKEDKGEKKKSYQDEFKTDGLKKDELKKMDQQIADQRKLINWQRITIKNQQSFIEEKLKNPLRNNNYSKNKPSYNNNLLLLLKKLSNSTKHQDLFKLGKLYLNGKQGFPKDKQEAVKWFTLAGKSGSKPAMHQLGSIYKKGGDGIVQSNIKAHKWWKLGATGGCAKCQMKLAALCEKGARGVAQNRKEAIKWYRLAALNGVENAQAKINHSIESTKPKANHIQAKQKSELKQKELIQKALINNNAKKLKLLLKEYPNFIHSFMIGFNAIFLAIKYNSIKCLQILINSKFNICKTYYCNEIKREITPVYKAVYEGRVQCLKILINNIKDKKNIHCPCEWGITPIYIASQVGHVKCLRMLIKHSNTKGAMYRLCEGGRSPIYIATQNGHVQCLKTLIKNIDLQEAIHRPCEDGITPIYLATQNGHVQCLKILIENATNSAVHAAVNEPCENGATPTYIASQLGHVACLDLLLAAKADVNKPCDDGATPVFAACEKGQDLCLELLIKKAKANVNKPCDDGATPVFAACKKGHDICLKFLLAVQADANRSVEDGATPAYVAAQNGHDQCLKALIKSQANLTQPRFDGTTPVYIAAQNGHDKCLKLLMKAKVAINQPANTGVLPVWAAIINKQNKCLKLFIEMFIDDRKNIPYQWEPHIWGQKLCCLVSKEKGYDKCAKLLTPWIYQSFLLKLESWYKMSEDKQTVLNYLFKESGWPPLFMIKSGALLPQDLSVESYHHAFTRDKTTWAKFYKSQQKAFNRLFAKAHLKQFKITSWIG